MVWRLKLHGCVWVWAAVCGHEKDYYVRGVGAEYRKGKGRSNSVKLGGRRKFFVSRDFSFLRDSISFSEVSAEERQE